MKTYQFTFRDIDNAERVAVTTLEGLDERWALQAAIDQLQDTAGDYAWQLIDTQLLATTDTGLASAPEEDFTA